ncbi:MAG TPA: glutamate racemase [Gammaproteobacteria bacterium]|nr:glutamate racemase [Gammaproteobacteria bacterium]
MSTEKQAIGVFDSGIGGMTALHKLAELLPHENLIYLGDTARVPYGNRSPETIRQYAQQSAEFLLQHSVKFMLIACNSISCVALSDIENLSPIPVMGVIKPAVDAALNRPKCHRIGIIGTRATIQSRAYEIEIHSKLNSDEEVSIYTMPCPLFVPLVEEGWHHHPVVYTIAKEYLQPLIEAKVDTLILACTHYPLLKKVIQEIMPDVHLVDSGEEAAIRVAKHITSDKNQDQTSNRKGKIECYLTDLSRHSLDFSQRFLGLTKENIHEISVG